MSGVMQEAVQSADVASESKPRRPDAQAGGVSPGLCARGRVLVPDPFLIAGIVNITPDSFSDGGVFQDPENALAHLRRIEADGAHILDLGAESTRPGADPVGVEEELRRLLPVLQGLCATRSAGAAGTPDATGTSGALGTSGASGAVISVDTFRAATAAAALEAGAEMINDISGGVFDPKMAAVVAGYKAGYVLGHSPAPPKTMREHPRCADVVETLVRHFEERMNVLVQAGLPEQCICLDPCIGFGKDLADTAWIFQNIPRLAALGRPLYFGLSRKSFIGEATGLDVHARGALSSVAAALCAAGGVTIHRVHDVPGTVRALALVRALYGRKPPA